MGLLRNMALAAANSTDVQVRRDVTNNLIDALTDADQKSKQNDRMAVRSIEYVFIDFAGQQFGLTKQQYLSVFALLRYATISNFREGQGVSGKIKAIKMLRQIRTNAGLDSGLKETKDAVENLDNFPNVVNKIVPTRT